MDDSSLSLFTQLWEKCSDGPSFDTNNIYKGTLNGTPFFVLVTKDKEAKTYYAITFASKIINN